MQRYITFFMRRAQPLQRFKVYGQNIIKEIIFCDELAILQQELKIRFKKVLFKPLKWMGVLLSKRYYINSMNQKPSSDEFQVRSGCIFFDIKSDIIQFTTLLTVINLQIEHSQADQSQGRKKQKKTRRSKNKERFQTLPTSNYECSVKLLMKLSHQLGDFFYKEKDPPDNWTTTVQIILFTLKIFTLPHGKKPIYKQKIKQQFDKKIQHQRYLDKGQKSTFHMLNIKQLMKIKNTVLLLLGKNKMPEPLDILQQMTEHLKYDPNLTNRGSLNRSQYRIRNGLIYILGQFKQYKDVPSEYITFILDDFFFLKKKTKIINTDGDPSGQIHVHNQQINNDHFELNLDANELNQQILDYNKIYQWQYNEPFDQPEMDNAFFLEDQSSQQDYWLNF